MSGVLKGLFSFVSGYGAMKSTKTNSDQWPFIEVTRVSIMLDWGVRQLLTIPFNSGLSFNIQYTLGYPNPDYPKIRIIRTFPMSPIMYFRYK